MHTDQRGMFLAGRDSAVAKARSQGLECHASVSGQSRAFKVRINFQLPTLLLITQYLEADWLRSKPSCTGYQLCDLRKLFNLCEP